MGPAVTRGTQSRGLRVENTALFALGLLAGAVVGAAGTTVPDNVLLETGRRIYEDGMLPGGEPLRAMRPEGFVLEGRHAACVTCHRRSGMGSVEGQSTAPSWCRPRPGHVEAVLGVLRAWSDTARGAGEPWHLHVWELSGLSATWPAQLEAHYRQQPVFALLSGVGRVEWSPVHMTGLSVSSSARSDSGLPS